MARPVCRAATRASPDCPPRPRCARRRCRRPAEVGDDAAGFADQQQCRPRCPRRRGAAPRSRRSVRPPRRPGRARRSRAGGCRWCAAAIRANCAWYSASRAVSLNGKPVPIRANPGSVIADTASRRSPCQAPPPTRRAVQLLARHVQHDPRLELSVHRGRDRHRIARESRAESWWCRRADRRSRPARRVTTSGLSSSPTIRLPGSAASSTSVMIRSAVRSTSVTKSRLPLWVQPAGSAGRSTPRRYAAGPLGGGSGQVQ